MPPSTFHDRGTPPLIGSLAIRMHPDDAGWPGRVPRPGHPRGELDPPRLDRGLLHRPLPARARASATAAPPPFGEGGGRAVSSSRDLDLSGDGVGLAIVAG